MLVLDFINVGNGDSILVREVESGQTRFAMLVDCGHDSLIRDDHPGALDPRSQRIYAGDFLKKQGIEKLDILLATHFHRDHIGGLGRVLDAAPDLHLRPAGGQRPPGPGREQRPARRGPEPPPLPGYLRHSPPEPSGKGEGIRGAAR